MAVEEMQCLDRRRIERPRHPMLLDSRIAKELGMVRKAFEHVDFACRNSRTTDHIGIVSSSAS